MFVEPSEYYAAQVVNKRLTQKVVHRAGFQHKGSECSTLRFHGSGGEAVLTVAGAPKERSRAPSG
jgi:hypothetical protein